MTYVKLFRNNYVPKIANFTCNSVKKSLFSRDFEGAKSLENYEKKGNNSQGAIFTIISGQGMEETRKWSLLNVLCPAGRTKSVNSMGIKMAREKHMPLELLKDCFVLRCFGGVHV